MKVYIDTEFFENGPDVPVRLISIGMVGEDGREFYAECSDFDWSQVPDGHWIQNNVRPHLKYAVGKSEFAMEHLIPQKKVHLVGPRLIIRKHIVNFFEGAQDLEFYGYFADYDWVVFCQIFGRVLDLPKGFPFYCMDLKQSMKERGLSGDWKRLVCPDPIGEHNALVDARWNAALHKCIMNEPATPR